MSDERIKPCPFCGCTVAAVYKAYDYESWHVSCMRCDVVTPEYDSEESAIEAWNTRKPMERIVERLENELELADKEKERSARENPLQFDSVKGYATGIYNAIEIVKAGGVDEVG